MTVKYRVQQNGRTIDILTESEYKKIPMETIVRRNLKMIRVVESPKKPIPKQRKKPMMSIDYYRKLAKKTEFKHKQIFAKRRMLKELRK